MSWPTNPNNGDKVTIGGGVYLYDAASGVWNRLSSSSVITGNAGASAETLTVGNLIVTKSAELGNIANVHLAGGSNGYYLTTDGAGTLRWDPASSVMTPGGNDSAVQFNDGGNFAGDSRLTFNKLNGVFTANKILGNGAGLSSIAAANILGTVANATYATSAASANIANTATTANFATAATTANTALTAGSVTNAVQTVITGVGTLTSLAVSGNITAGNVNGKIFGPLNGVVGGVTPNAGTFTQVNITGNATVGGNITATNAGLGNLVTANYISGTITQAGADQPNITSMGALTGLHMAANSLVLGHLIPAGNEEFSLGSETHRWKNLYLSGNTISLGGAVLTTTSNGGLSASGGLSADTMTIPGQYITTYVLDANSVAGPPFVVSSNIVVANLNVSFLNGLQATSSNIGNTIVSRDANRSFGANIITARLYGSANTANTVIGISQPNITSLGNLTGLTVLGNLKASNADLGNLATANFFSGDGGNITNITLRNVTGSLPASVLSNTSINIGNTSITLSREAAAQTLEGVSIDGDANTANTAGTVTTAAQPNITSVGTLTDLTINGNLIVSGTTSYSNVTTFNVKDPVIELGGNPNGATLSGSDGKDRGLLLHYFTDGAVDAFMGWDHANTEFIFASNVSVTTNIITTNELGNIRAKTFIGNISGNSLYANTSGTVETNAQPNITSVGTLTKLSVSAGSKTASTPITFSQTWNNGSAAFTGIYENITDTASAGESKLIDLAVGGTSKFAVSKAGNITGSFFLGNGSQLTGIDASNVSGKIANATYADLALKAGTITASSQPNITEVGTLTALHVSSGELPTVSIPVKVEQTWNNTNIAFTAIKVDITSTASASDSDLIDMAVGGTTVFNVDKIGNVYANNFVGNFSGNLSGNIKASGSNTQILFNDSNNVGATTDFTYDKTTGILSIPSLKVAGGVIAADSPANFTQVWNNASVVFTGIKQNISDNFSDGNSLLIDLQVSSASKFKINKSGNVTATKYTGSGAGLSGVAGANVSGTVANATYALTSGATDSATTAGTVTTNAQPNITSTGTLTGLKVATAALTATTPILITQTWNNANIAFTGFKENIIDTASNSNSLMFDLAVSNISKFKVTKAGDVTANAFTGDGSGLASLAGANVTGTVANATYATSAGSATTATSAGSATTAGTVTTNAQPNITSVGTLTGLTVVAGEATVPTPLSFTQTWNNAGAVFTGINENITDTASGANSLLMNLQVGSVSKFKVTKAGNVTASYFIGNGSQLTNLTAPDSVANANAANFANVSNFAGSVTTNAQGNITSVGTLTALTIDTGTAALTTSTPISIAQKWDNASTLFTGFKLNVANANSNANSILMDLQVNGVSKFNDWASNRNVNMSTGRITANQVAGRVVTASQPEITSLGTIQKLRANGIYEQTIGLAAVANVVSFASLANGGPTIIMGVTNNWLTLEQYTNLNKLAAGDYAVVSGIPSAVSIKDANGVVTNSFNGTYTLTGVANTPGPNFSVTYTVTGTLPDITAPNANSASITVLPVRKIIGGDATTGNTVINMDEATFGVANVGTLNITGDFAAATVTKAAQGNITSVGTLTGLTVGNATANTVFGNGTISAAGNASFGGKITGGLAAGELLLLGNTANASDKYINIRGANGNLEFGTTGNTEAYIYNLADSPINFYTNSLIRGGWANSGEFSIASTTAASSNITGALKVAGGVGIKGNIYANVYFGNGSQLTSVVANTANYANVSNFAGTVTANAQGNITSVGTLTGLTVGNATANSVFGNGTITLNAGLITGNGAGLSQLAGANVTGQVPNALVAGTVYTGAQPSITSVGILTNLNTGNVSVSQSMLTGSGKVAFISNVSGGGGGASISFGSPTTLTSAQYAQLSKIKAGDSVIISGAIGDAVSLNTTYLVSAVGLTPSTVVSAIVTPDVITKSGGGANVASINVTVQRSTISTAATGITGFFDIANIGTLNATGQIISTIATGTAPFTVTSTTQVANLNAATAGTVITAAQPNITSVGTLTSLGVTGDITSGNANLGNLVTANYFTGTLTTASQPNITSHGILTALVVDSGTTGLVASAPIKFAQSWNNTSITFTGIYANFAAVKSDSASKIIDLAVTKTTGTAATSKFSVTQEGNLAVVNADLGNVAAANFFTGTLTTAAQPNITSVGTLSVLTVSGNATAGNLKATGFFYANGTELTQATSYNNTMVASYLLTNTGNIKAGNADLGNAAVANYFVGDGSKLTNLAAIVSTQNLTTTGSLTVGAGTGGNISGANLITSNYFSGIGLTLTGEANFNNTVNFKQSTELIATKTGATGVVVHSFLDGGTFYHTSPAANFTVNITNVPTTDSRAIVIVILVAQGVTPYMPTALQIDGVAQTIKWLSGVTPAGTASKLDACTFSLLRVASTWVVTGQAVSYG